LLSCDALMERWCCYVHGFYFEVIAQREGIKCAALADALELSSRARIDFEPAGARRALSDANQNILLVNPPRVVGNDSIPVGATKKEKPRESAGLFAFSRVLFFEEFQIGGITVDEARGAPTWALVCRHRHVPAETIDHRNVAAGAVTEFDDRATACPRTVDVARVFFATACDAGREENNAGWFLFKIHIVGRLGDQRKRSHSKGARHRSYLEKRLIHAGALLRNQRVT